MKIGLTGGIGTGKSTVSEILKKYGYPVIDSDKIAHKILEDPIVIQQLVNIFGEEILLTGTEITQISRKKLRDIVFASEEKLELLNQIVHPKIINTIIDEIKENQKIYSIIFVDIPLLFESNLMYLVDKIVLIYAPKDLQIKRIIERDQTTKEKAIQIIDKQFDIELKKEKSDYIIYNIETKEVLEKNIMKMLEILQKEERE